MSITRYITALDIDPNPDHVAGLTAKLAKAPKLRAAAPPQEGAKSASVVAGSLVSFVEGLTDQNKADVKNSTLLAQLAANKQYDRYQDAVGWYKFYVNVLENVGWNIPAFAFQSYQPQGTTFTMDAVVLQILAAIASQDELAIVEATMDALKATADDSNQMTIFDASSSKNNVGNFQVFPVSQTPENDLVMALTGLQFNSTTQHARFLWWSWSTTEVSLQRGASRMELNRSVYSQVRQQIIDKLGSNATTFIADLDI